MIYKNQNASSTKLTFGGIFIALIFIFGLMPASVRGAVSPNVNLSKQTGYQGETTIVIDPTNPNRMFASSNESANALFAAYSTDGGTTWQYPDPTDKTIADGGDALPRACCDPSAVFDQFGNLYLTYLTASPVNVVVAVSTNGGQSFGGTTLTAEEQIIGVFPLESGFGDATNKRLLREDKGSEEDADALNTPGDQPTVAAGPSFFAGEASVWVSWDASNVIKVAGTRVTGLGAITPFSNTPIVTPLAGFYGDIEVGQNGQVLVAAQAASSGQGPTSISVSLDPDGLGPATFNPPVSIPIGNKKWFSSPNVENFGASILVSATNVGGFDFIPAQPSRSVDAEADLAWDRSGGAHNGRVYLVYTDETVNENNDMDTLLRYSDNNGATWTAPLRVNDDATTRSQFLPRVEVDQTTGNVAVAFYDCRNDAAGTDGVANTEAQVFGAISFNGGGGFQANELISQGSSRSPSFGNSNEYGDYNGLAFRANKYFYIWSDNSNSTGDNANGTRTSPDIYTAKVTIAAPRRAQFDFDGDAKTDISIFRPTAGEWWINRSSSNQTTAAQFGQSTDKITPGDFTGDGKTDIAFWRPDTGVWFVLRSEDGSFFSFAFGANGDFPVPADYDNDGKTDAAVFRPSNSTWYILRSGGGTTIAQFGAGGDVPAAADYDGDGRADIAIFRPGTGEWWIQRSTAGLVAFQFGNSTDKPVPGDYTGDGKADAAFFRASTGVWFVLRSEDSSFFSAPFGTGGDLPVAGDYDGDGKLDLAVFRPSNSTWFIQRTTAGTQITAFGTTGDRPVPNAFVP